jgi:antitoxin component YwqK of YwqJK toxin-antitoxin module
VWLFWSLNLFSQNQSLSYDDLKIFTTRFTNNDLTNPVHQQTFVDSTVEVVSEIHVEISLISEKAYWQNGQLKFYRYYQNNTPFGIWKYYESNGDIKYTLQHSENLFTIQLHFPNNNNNIQSIKTYRLDVKQNILGCDEENFFPEGQIRSFGKKSPVKGLNQWELLEIGKWKFFFINGKTESIGIFKNGIKEGKWLFYQPSGVLKRWVRFKDGIPVKQKEFTN